MSSIANYTKKDSIKLVQWIKSNNKDSRWKIAEFIEEQKEYQNDTLSIPPESSIETQVDDFVDKWKKIKLQSDSIPVKELF